MVKEKVFKTTSIVAGSEIVVTSKGESNNDYISLIDMTKNFEGGNALIEQWLRNKDTILFMGTWEKLYNSGFNSLEFKGVKNVADFSEVNWSNSTSLNTIPQELKGEAIDG
jgi:hypothetical protein